MVSNKILKKNAREQIGGKIFTGQWMMMLLVTFVCSTLLGAANNTGFGAILIGGALLYGLARVQLKVIRGIDKKADFLDLFVGFDECYGSTIGLYCMTTLFLTLWSLLLFVPGIIKSYSYALAPYIQQDSRDKSWRNCLDTSIDMMQGHKGQLFVLDLSFIGWYLLGMLCLGVGALFVVPYHQMARANFYEALRAENPVY